MRDGASSARAPSQVGAGTWSVKIGGFGELPPYIVLYYSSTCRLPPEAPSPAPRRPGPCTVDIYAT
eukprot:4164873-Prymnesium_polylepis.1